MKVFVMLYVAIAFLMELVLVTNMGWDEDDRKHPVLATLVPLVITALWPIGVPFSVWVALNEDKVDAWIEQRSKDR